MRRAMTCAVLAALTAGPASAEILRDQSRGWMLTVDGGGIASGCESSLVADSASATMLRCGQAVRIDVTGVEIEFPGEGRGRAPRPRCSIELADSVVRIDGRIVWPFTVTVDRVGQAGRMLEEMRIAQEAGFEEAARNCAAFAHDLGEPLALVPYGRMLRDGRGGAADEAAALALFEEAARMGMMDGIVSAGLAYSQGRGAEADPAKAARYYRRAARGGSRVATRNLILLATRTDFEVVSYEDTLGWLDRLEELGGSGVDSLRRDAAFEASWAARRAEDGVRARALAQEAIDLGHPRAPALLGRMHRTGLGGPVDHARAIELYRIGIEIGDRDAILRMGYMHGQGLGVPQSDAEALRLYRRAARMGSRVATLNIVEVAIRGDFQVMSYDEADEWMVMLEEAEDRRAEELRAELEAARDELEIE